MTQNAVPVAAATPILVAARHGTRKATRGEIANLAAIPLIFVGGWADRDPNKPRLRRGPGRNTGTIDDGSGDDKKAPADQDERPTLMARSCLPIVRRNSHWTAL